MNNAYENNFKSSLTFKRSILAEIHRLYETQVNNNCLELEDETKMKAIGKFLGLICKNAYDYSESQISKTHFLFIIPTEWDEDIRKKFLPKLFEFGELISSEDPANRLIFLTVLESTVAAMQNDNNAEKYDIEFSREEKHLYCDLYINDIDLPTEVVLQAFQVEDEQMLRVSSTTPEQTKRLLVPRLIDAFTENSLEFASCNSFFTEANEIVESFLNTNLTDSLEANGKTMQDIIHDIMVSLSLEFHVYFRF